MENFRKRIKIDLVISSHADGLRRWVANPAYISHKIFTKDLVAIHSVKSKLKLDRPVYFGQEVLDLNKHLMYDFWYNIKARYDEKAQLLYTDTDSLLLVIETPDVYADMWTDKHHYDFSDYPKNHQYRDVTNRKLIGKLKD